MKRWYWGAVGVVTLVVVAIFGALAGDGSSQVAISTTTQPSSPASTITTVPPLSSVSTLAPPEGSERATVARIVDGDTVVIDLLAGGQEKVRLIGINTPESGECFSEEATVALGALLADEVFSMTSDVSDRDQYGRLLRYLWLDRGVFVNEIMVRGGYAQARDFPPDSRYAAEIASAEEAAQTEADGLWAHDACGPASRTGLRVIDVLADPPGSDTDDSAGEWVEIANTGSTEIRMRGWVLKDESSRHRFAFPEEFVIAPGGVVRVLTGCGLDTDETLYWCNGSAVWNNKGDTAFLLDPNGNIATFYRY